MVGRQPRIPRVGRMRRRPIDNGTHDHALWRCALIGVFLFKFDGYRALAIKPRGKVHLRSRNHYHFNGRYPGLVKALAPMPDDTVIDGEVVALDADGRPSFNALQNYGSAGAPLHFFIFDVLILQGKDVMGEPLTKRRELIEEHVLP